MKFQNPSFKIFLNGRTHGRTHGRTDKPKAICSPLFQSWGYNYEVFIMINHVSGTEVRNEKKIAKTFEPCHEKTNSLVSDQV